MFKPQFLSPPELFIASAQLVRPATSPFYAKLDQTLESFGFAAQARLLCAPAYSKTGRGRPGVDPVVYFKMLMVGFFEDIPSERGMAERCNDSISLRAFLGYDLTQTTPDHSTLSVIRQRLGPELYGQVFDLILRALEQHGLLKGKNLGVDASVIEANASLKNLVNRNTAEAYWEYVQRLANENGIDPKDADAVRQFDRKRPKKMSNEEWVNPFEPDAKIGPTKAGATDMIYKPEHIVDLDTGAIVQAEVRLGDEADAKDLCLHLLQAQVSINEAKDLPADRLTIESATADKGYFAVAEMKALQAEGERRQLEALLSGEADSNDSYVEVHSGAGGTESCDWARMLLRMYMRWGERRGFAVEVIEETDGDEAGIKSATIVVKGHNAHGWLKTESGVHRLVRISPFDSNARRHTSFASVWVYPVVDDRIEIDVNESDCRIDTYRASGAGGQHVNKTESAVRITHLPTGIVVACQGERSQHKNRATAWAMLRARLYERALEEREAKATADAASKTEIGWGRQIRSYVLQPYQMVKDLRTGHVSSAPAEVLDGDLDAFMEASLAQRLSGRTVAVEDVE